MGIFSYFGPWYKHKAICQKIFSVQKVWLENTALGSVFWVRTQHNHMYCILEPSYYIKPFNMESSALTIKPLFLLHATYCDLQKREKDGEQHLKEEEQRRREKLRQHEAKVKMPYSAKRLNCSILGSTIKFILFNL